MRFAVVIFSIVWCGCTCSPSAPMAVTLRLNNTSMSTLFVDDTLGILGMHVQRGATGAYQTFVESTTCACQACDQACNGTCGCGTPEARVQRVPPGGVFERQWAGVIEANDTALCGALGTVSPACLSPTNAPYNETFNLHLCYALSAPTVGFSADGGSVSGALPATGQTCVDKEFRIEDGVAEISPVRGADCVSTTDCKGDGELCLSGACTASCPDNGYPSIGNNWNVALGVTDMGFFDITTDPAGRTVSTGTGTISSAAYNGNAVRIHLNRIGTSGESLTAYVDLTVPPGALGPLSTGEGVTVKTVEPGPNDNPDDTAMVIHDTTDGGTLIVAVDSAQGTALLTAADRLPFAVTFNSDVPGCAFTDCGKVLFATTTFAASGKSVTLEPGKSANVVTPAGTYDALNVYAARNDVKATCDLADIRPYLLWRTQAPVNP